MDYGTEIITLPSGGRVYPASSPLSKGQVELRIMTAEDENILASPNHGKKGQMHLVDKLIKRLSVEPFDSSELIEGDRLALLIGIRVVSYGKEYPFRYYSTETGQIEEAMCDLTKLADKPLKANPIEEGLNRFTYKFPVSEKTIEFQLPTVKVNEDIRLELESLKMLGGDEPPVVTTRYNHLILSVDGDTKVGSIRSFVKSMSAFDSRSFRKYLSLISPDVDVTMTVSNDRYTEEGVDVPLSISDLLFPE